MYLGIEIGGTKLQLGIGPGDGTLAGLWRGSVDVAAGEDGIRKQIIAAVPELLTQTKIDRSQLQGVGIGFGGPVDDSTHTVIKSHQIEGWDGFPLADWISEIVELPAALGNDADVAGLAEALFGAGKGLSPIFYITIGSGIGGGLIINGEIYRGCGRGAAEIGHLQVQVLNWSEEYEAFPLEQLASGWAIRLWAHEIIIARRRSGMGLSSILLHSVNGRLEDIDSRHIGEAAEQGDELARFILQRPLACLAEGICHLMALLSPRRIVIGGGVSLMGDEIFFEPLRKLVGERVFKPFADCYDIVPAALGEEVVVHGALALARKQLQQAKP